MWVRIPAWPVAALVSLSKTLNHNCFVLRMGRKAVGPVCCVMHVKEPRTLIVKEKELAPVFLDSCLEHPTGWICARYKSSVLLLLLTSPILAVSLFCQYLCSGGGGGGGHSTIYRPISLFFLFIQNLSKNVPSQFPLWFMTCFQFSEKTWHIYNKLQTGTFCSECFLYKLWKVSFHTFLNGPWHFHGLFNVYILIHREWAYPLEHFVPT